MILGIEIFPPESIDFAPILTDGLLGRNKANNERYAM